MNSQVLIQIRLLCKALVTARFLTTERPFTCVDSQMVEEIMPLSEVHVAIQVVAFKNLDIPLGSWILIFEYTKQPCRGNLLINFNRAKIKCVTSFNKDVSSFGDFISDLTVGDVLSRNPLLNCLLMLILLAYELF
jgi:hypothetical protein